jgi:hypothetical protein
LLLYTKMNELRYDQYNKSVMKSLRKDNVSTTQEPKWIDPKEYNKKILNNFSPDWRRKCTTSPTEQPSALRPKHYGGADSTYEVFKVLEAWELDKDFYLGNVIKYIARAGKKNPAKEKEDLQKALVYLQRRIDSL